MSSDAPLLRSAPNAVRAEGDLPDGVLKFVLCRSDETDAHSSRILPQGCDLSRHRTNPVFLWQHQSGTNAIGAAPGPEVVIGKVTEYQQDERELVITVLFDLEDDLAATCYRKCKQGFLNGVSIGCRVDPDAARIEKIDGIDVTIYPKSTLLEASLVILPSLGSALRVDRAAAATLLRSLGSEGVSVGNVAGVTVDASHERAIPAAYADIGKGERGVGSDNAVVTRADPTPTSIPSAMLALYPNLEAARSIAVEGGYSPEDLHLTLACFDNLPDAGAERLEIVASSWAKSHTPLEGEIGGCGRFYQDGGDVFYAVPDLPKMEAVRDGILCDLKYGAPSLIPTDTHGYSPHITLSKITDGEASPKAPPRIPLHFYAISVVVAGVRKDFNFVTPDNVVVEGAVSAAATPAATDMPNPFLASLGSTPDIAPALPPPVAAIVQNEASGSVLGGVSGDSQGANAIDPMRSLPYTRDIVQPGVTPGEKLVYTSKVEKTMKTSREYRGMVRGLMNLEMDGAEMHGYLAEMDGMADEMRASHREAMKCGLKRAEDMVRLIAIDLDDDEGECGMERTVPGLKDAEMRAMFAGVAQKVGKLPLTLRQVVKDRFGTEDPIAVETRAMAWQGSQERLKKLTDERRALANQAQSDERERLIAQYLDPKVAVISPAEAQEMRGLNPATGEPNGKPAWSPERIHTLIRERGGAPIVEISRVAPLNPVAGAAQPVNGAQPLVQREGVNGAPVAKPPVANALRFSTNANHRAVSPAMLDNVIASGAAALGMTPDQVRALVAERAQTGVNIVAE